MRKGIAAAVAFTVWLVPAAPAGADLYVEKSAPAVNTACTQQDPCDRINDAVTPAGNGDTIHIGPGSYPERIATQTRLIFKGAGAGPRDGGDLTPFTVVTGQANAGSTFNLSGGGSITGIRVSGQPQGAMVPGGAAIELRSTAGTPRQYALTNVVALGGSPTTIGQGMGRALLTQGSSGGPASVAVTDSVLAQDDDNGANTTPTADVGSGASLDVRSSTVDPGNEGTGIKAFGDGLRADGIQILSRSPTRFGLVIGGQATIVRSRIAADEVGAFVPRGPLDLRDSIVAVTRDTTTAFPVSSVWISGESARTDVTATGATLLTRGPDVDYG